MKKLAMFMVLTAFVFAGCRNANEQKKKSETVSAEELKKEIAELEKQLFDDKSNTIDLVKSNLLIEKYTRFADLFPNDSMAPEFLFKASDIAMNSSKPGKTISLYNRIIKNYPGYKNVSACYFLKGFVYDDQLKEYGKAEKYYRLYLEKYPDGEFADDAEAALKYLGKSPEELIKLFEAEQKNK